MIRRCGWLLVGLLLSGARGAAAEGACQPCGDGEGGACHQRLLNCLLAQGRGSEALRRLKALTRRYPRRAAFRRLLAQAYLKQQNPFWAQRTLDALITRDANDCDSRALLAWVHTGEGDLDLARTLLAEGKTRCPKTTADRARWALLRAYLSLARKDLVAARRELVRATDAGRVYPEDLELWRVLHTRTQARRMVPLRLRGEVGLGYASNAGAGLPTTETRGEAAAAVLLLDVYAQLVYPTDHALRPTLELSTKGQLLADFGDEVKGRDVSDASYLELTARPGLFYLSSYGKWLAAYRYDLLLLNSGDRYHAGAQAFYEAHRGELELELARGITLFSGFGRRFFRQAGRSRWEIDGGGGWTAGLGPIHLLLAGTLRYYHSTASDFRLVGATALAAGRLWLPAGLYVRVGLSGGIDHYADAQRVDSSERGGVDVQVKVSSGLWSPSWRGLRIGATYQYAWRRTNVEISFPYQDHRVLLRARFALELDPWAPKVVRPHDHLAIDYGLNKRDGAPRTNDERIQDLLRQDEAARRGSSCVN